MSDFVTQVHQSDRETINEDFGPAGLFIREITPTHERYAHPNPTFGVKLLKGIELTVATSRCRNLLQLGRIS